MRRIPGNVLSLMALAQPAIDEAVATARSEREIDEETARKFIDEQRAQEQQRDRLMAEIVLTIPPPVVNLPSLAKPRRRSKRAQRMRGSGWRK